MDSLEQSTAQEPHAAMLRLQFRTLPGDNEEEMFQSILGLFHSSLLKINTALFFKQILRGDSLTAETHVRHLGHPHGLPGPRRGKN